MSQRTKRGIALTTMVCLAVSAGMYFFIPRVGVLTAAVQALPDTGKFRAGSALGEERAGFSGRMMVQVFTSAAARDWSTIAVCLQSAPVTQEMDFYTGILVDEVLEPEVEATLRDRDGLRVVIRDLQGAVRGHLPAGFTCDDLVGLLQSVRVRSTRPPVS